MPARKNAQRSKKAARAGRRPAARPTARRPSPHLTVVTLGVQDMGRSRTFYCEGLGLRASGSSNESIVFMDAGGVVLALYRRKLLADDANMPSEGSGFGGFTLARNVGSKAEVDAALDVAKKAGATIVKPAHEAFWGGYSGYFADPDGHAWEVAYNPHWKLGANGQVLLPK